MGILNSPNRRTFVAAKLGVAATLGVPGIALAKSDINAGWDTICALEFEMLKGQFFTIKSDDGETMKLRLTEVVAGKSGSARPKHLRRKEGLIAVFDAPKSVCEKFVEVGHHTVDIRHPALGAGRAFLGAVPDAKGRHKIEMVLN